MDQVMMSDQNEAPLALIEKQRSHVVFVLSSAEIGQEPAFLNWYQGVYRKAVSDMRGVLSVQHYEQHEVDITAGQYAPLPFKYLGFYEISVDGALAAEGMIERITLLHREQAAAAAPATWLYYPASERVGRSPKRQPLTLTLAFANGVPGQEAEFREWYATRHIRHALNIPALVSGQTFERTIFQEPGALEAKFATIAVYEQVGTPESILESFATVPEETFRFPAMDMSRFAEWVYRPLGGS